MLLPEAATLNDIDHTLLVYGSLPELWPAKEITVVNVHEYFSGEHTVTPASVGGLLVLVMASWTPVVIGFGSTLAASILLMNTALGSYAYKMLARNEQAS